MRRDVYSTWFGCVIFFPILRRDVYFTWDLLDNLDMGGGGIKYKWMEEGKKGNN